MADLLINGQTKLALNAYLEHPAHAVCLVGPMGTGKGHIARYICEKLLKSADDGSVLAIEAGEAGIEHVRKLQHFLQLKKPGQEMLKRAVIIEHAELLGAEAQNALLKTLEEPPADTIFILTTSGLTDLKPTIRSRVVTVLVGALGIDEAETAFPGQGQALAKAFALSGGYAGLLQALMTNPEHELVEAVTTAKALLQSSSYERLSQIDQITKQKADLTLLIYALQRVLGAVMSKAKPSQMPKLVRATRALYEAEQDLKHSANKKLLLTDLFMSL